MRQCTVGKLPVVQLIALDILWTMVDRDTTINIVVGCIMHDKGFSLLREGERQRGGLTPFSVCRLPVQSVSSKPGSSYSWSRHLWSEPESYVGISVLPTSFDKINHLNIKLGLLLCPFVGGPYNQLHPSRAVCILGGHFCVSGFRTRPRLMLASSLCLQVGNNHRTVRRNTFLLVTSNATIMSFICFKNATYIKC